MKFTKIGIIGKYGVNQFAEIVERLIFILEKEKFSYHLDKNTMPAEFKNHLASAPIHEWSQLVDLTLVIGGDGTFLYAARALSDTKSALIGINAGRLGYLNDVVSSQLEEILPAMLHGGFVSEQRNLLQVRIARDKTIVEQHCALNDVVIHKNHMARMIDLEVFCNGNFFSHYRADGLIISTPTGSTAYALAAGGAIIEPSLPVISIVPICPQTLNQRAVIVDERHEISVPINHIESLQITLDGQEEYFLQPHDCVLITKGAAVQVLHPQDYQFHKRLRQKLGWGI